MLGKFVWDCVKIYYGPNTVEILQIIVLLRYVTEKFDIRRHFLEILHYFGVLADVCFVFNEFLLKKCITEGSFYRKIWVF